jgi:hypothetical protein
MIIIRVTITGTIIAIRAITGIIMAALVSAMTITVTTNHASIMTDMGIVTTSTGNRS